MAVGPALAEQDALDPLAVGELEEEFFGAVVGAGVGGDGGGPDREPFRQAPPQARGEVGHVGERFGPAPEQPAADRLGPPGGLPEFGEGPVEGVAGLEGVCRGDRFHGFRGGHRVAACSRGPAALAAAPGAG